MSAYPEIDQLFGQPVGITTEGKMMNTKTGTYILGGVIVIFLVIGIVAAYKSLSLETGPKILKKQDKT
jgi:hypothetical protein